MNSKTVLFIFCTAALGFLAFCSSSNNPQEVAIVNTKNITNTAGDPNDPVVSDREEALNRIEAFGGWMKRNNTNPQDTLPFAWEIPIEKIKNLDSNYKTIRGYLAIEGTEGIASSNLYFVPMVGRKEKTETIFNLVNPCPNVCDPSSDLYQAFYNGFNGK